MKIVPSKASFGTQDYYVDMVNKTIRKCRFFANVLADSLLKVLCQKALNISMPDLDFDTIENINLDYSRLLLVYTKLVDIKTDKTDVCYVLVNLKSGISSKNCFHSIYGETIRTRIVLSPFFSYILVSNDDDLTGVYLKGYSTPVKIPNIASGVKMQSFSLRRIGSTDSLPEGLTQIPEIELGIIRAGLVNVLLIKEGKVIFNKHAEAAIGTESKKEYVCTTAINEIAASDFGLSILSRDGEIFPLSQYSSQESNLAVTHVECLESGSILVQRGQILGYNLLTYAQIIGDNRGQRQTLYRRNPGNEISIHSNFISSEKQYLYSQDQNKVYKLNTNPQAIYAMSKTKSQGKMHFKVQDAFNQSNSKLADAVYTSVLNSYLQNYSKIIQSKPARQDGAHFLDIEYFPIVTGEEGHFIKFESYPSPNHTLVNIVNRFEKLDISWLRKSDVVSHIHREGMEVYYAEGRFLLYEEFSDRLIGEFTFDLHYVTQILDLRKRSEVGGGYTMLARVDSTSKRGIVTLDFSRDANDRFTFLNQTRLNLTLEEEDRDVRSLYIKDSWYVAAHKESLNSTLTIIQFSTENVLFKKQLVDKFEVLWPDKNSTAEGKYVYVIYSVLGSNDVFQSRIDLNSSIIMESKLEVGLTMAEFSGIKCKSSSGRNKILCVFAGIRLYWVEPGLRLFEAPETPEKDPVRGLQKHGCDRRPHLARRESKSGFLPCEVPKAE